MQKSILDDITTLEEARQQIALLLESQKNAHYFLYIFCNYAIKEPLLTLKGFTELLKREEYRDEHPSFLQTITATEQKMLELINTVGFLALDERMKYDQPHESRRKFEPEAIALESFLTRAKSQIQEFADHENAESYRSLQIEDQHDPILRKLPPIQTHFDIPDDLPLVKSNPALLESSISDGIHLITRPGAITGLFIQTTIEEEAIKIVLGCFTSTPNTYLLENFQRFETASSIFEFDPQFLSLYQNWLYLKTHEGILSLDIQDDKTAKEHSIVSVTIRLKKWQ